MPSEIGATRPATLRLTIPCDLNEVRPAAQAVTGFLADQGCNADEMTACSLALAEACNNAVQYAPSEALSFPVHIETLVTREAVEIRVTDHTLGFDWPAEIALPEPGSESGRGLFIIHSVSDRAGYLRGRDHNVLYFRHARTSRPKLVPTAANDPVTEQLIEEVSSCYESLSAIFRHSAASHEGAQLRSFTQHLLDDLRRGPRVTEQAVVVAAVAGDLGRCGMDARVEGGAVPAGEQRAVAVAVDVGERAADLDHERGPRPHGQRGDAGTVASSDDERERAGSRRDAQRHARARPRHAAHD